MVPFHSNILIQDLQTVVMNVLLIDQVNVLGSAIITLKDLDIVFLNYSSLFNNAFIGACDILIEKPFPLIV